MTRFFRWNAIVLVLLVNIPEIKPRKVFCVKFHCRTNLSFKNLIVIRHLGKKHGVKMALKQMLRNKKCSVSSCSVLTVIVRSTTYLASANLQSVHVMET
jgi:hypothetical protein